MEHSIRYGTIGFLKGSIDSSFDRIRSFKKVTDKAISNELKELEALVSNSSHEIKELHYLDEHHLVGYYHGATLSHCLLLSCYATLEYHLNFVCKYLGEDKRVKIKHTDLKGTLLTQCKKYLVELLGIEIPDSYWNSLKPYEKVRHVIAHSNGILLEHKNESIYIKNYSQKEGNSLLSIQDDYLVLSDTFLENAINDIEKFLNHLLMMLSKWAELEVVK